MNTDSISLRRCIREGWGIFESSMGMAVGSYALYMLIAMAAGQFGPIYTILAAFPLQGSIVLWFLAMAKGVKPEIGGDMFSGFASVENWTRWLGVGWLLAAYEFAVMFVCGIVGGVFVVIGTLVFEPSSAPGIMLIVIGALVFIIATTAITMRWIFVFFAAAEGATATEAIERSVEMTQGIRWKLFWILLVIYLICATGMLAACVGVFFTGPLAQCMECALYLDVKGMRARQADASASEL